MVHYKVRMLRVVLLVTLLLNSGGKVFCADEYSRKDFPPGFVFGAGTSAYQVEGAANEDGRSPSIWDTFTHEGNMGGATGDIALDQYHKYKEDVQLMVETGLEAYRFSISWSRLIPNGRGPANPKGLQYYNNLINELTRHGIQPHVLFYNYDHPQVLEDEYGGWVSRKMVKDFTDYADVCFREFGDRVSYWTTINEPNIFAVGGYDEGITPPKRCSAPFSFVPCSRGNSSSEPYLAAHHMLLAHASAARLYKKKYLVKQHGYIGLTLFAFWFKPVTNSTEDMVALERAKDFFYGWMMHPLMYGDYPSTMKKIVGSRLPTFTAHDAKLVKDSFDFIGLIHYQSVLLKDNSITLLSENRDFNADAAIQISLDLYATEYAVEPSALEGVLRYFKQAYGNPPIFVYENGQRNIRNSSLEDTSRVKYLRAYIGGLLDEIRNGTDVRGYFIWSFLDVFELLDGFKSGFGLYYVDLDDRDLKRCPKLSAHWYSHFLRGGNVSSDGIIELASKFSKSSSRTQIQ